MRIVEKDQFCVIGKKVICEEHKLPLEMTKIFKHVNDGKLEIINRVNDLIMDITIEKKGSIYKRIVGYEVSNIDEIPQGFTGLTIPKSNYLFYQHKGIAYEIYDAFVIMYDFAIENKIELDCCEFKIERYNDNTNEYDLYLKLKE